MRLTDDEQDSIKRIIAKVFGDGAQILLFGSRTDDSKRGGDVDLYVIPTARDSLFDKRVTCLGQLERVLSYPVDLVVAEPDSIRPTDRIALKTGVML
jgi:predicted nucleotidyltransferase